MIYPCNTEAANKDILDRIDKASKRNIGQTSGKQSLQRSTPWWNSECSRRVALRRKAKRKAEKYPSRQNIIEMKKTTAEAKYIIKVSKRNSLKDYVGSLTADTSMTEAWKKFKCLTSHYTQYSYLLIVNDSILTSNSEKAKIFGEKFMLAAKLSKQNSPVNLDDMIQQTFQKNNRVTDSCKWTT